MDFSTLLIIEIITASITAVITITLGVAVYKHNRSSATNRIFSLLCFVILLWIIVVFCSLNQNIFSHTLWWIRFSMLLAMIQSTLLFLFAHTIPNERTSLHCNWMILIWVVTGTMMILSLTPYLFSSYDIRYNLPSPQPEIGMAFFTIYAVILLSSAAYQLWIKQKVASGLMRQRLLFVLSGFVMMHALIISTIVLPIGFFQNSRFVPLHFIYLLTFLLPTAYAIMRYRFLDVRIVLRKSLIVGSLFVLSLAIVIAILLIAKKLVSIYFSISDDILVLTSMTILLLIFPKIKHSCQKLIDRYIFTDYIDLSVKIKEFEASVPESTMMQELVQRTAKFIEDNIKVRSVRFLVYDHVDKHRFVSRYPIDQNLIIQSDDPLIQYCQQQEEIIVKAELQLKASMSDLEKRVIRRLDTLHAEAAVPYGEQGQCYGLLLLGSKSDQKAFSTNELDSLDKLAKSLTHLVPQIATAEMVKADD